MRKILAGLLATSVLALGLAAPSIASAQFAGQPTWLSDPSGVCSYVGRAGCPLNVANEPGTQVTGASGVVSAATAAASLPAVSAKTNYLTGFSITGGGATGASLITCTLSGLITGSETYVFAVVAGATLGDAPLTRTFAHPVPASAANVAIQMSCPTFGTGNTAAAVNIEGYVR